MPSRCVTDNDLGEIINNTEIAEEHICPQSRSSVGTCPFKDYSGYTPVCLFDDMVMYHKRRRAQDYASL